MKKVLLYSGGMDSWLIDKLWEPDIKIYVNMHTEYSNWEIARLPKDVDVVDLPIGQYSLNNSIIPLRNLYLFLVAFNVTYFEDAEICLGALDGDRINDKSQEFVDLLNPLLKYLYEEQFSQPGRNVKAVMPYKKYSKRELLEMYIEKGGDIDEVWYNTFSCYHPKQGKMCLDCKACFRKAIPFIVAGREFTDDEKSKLKSYVNRVVIPNINDYTQDKGKAGIDCKKALEIIGEW